MLKTLVSLLFFFPYLIVTQQDIDQAQLELNQQLTQLDNISAQIQSVNEQKQVIEEEITTINTDINQTQAEIIALEGEIADNETAKENQIAISSTVLVGYQQIINDNMLINSIFNPNDEYNVITRIENNEKLVDLVVDEVFKSIEIENQLITEKQELETNKAKLTQSQEQLESDKTELENKNNELTQLQTDTYAYADDIKAQIADMETEMKYQNMDAYIPNDQKEALMSSVGIDESDFPYVDYIITHESSWNYTATNPISGAYGLCQALPGSKMTTSGSDWETNPQTQMDWCNNYAISRYGSWSGAYNFWVTNNWW